MNEMIPLPWRWLFFLVYACVKVSLSEKLMLNYATLGFPFFRGFPSHEWNETNPLTTTAVQVYECEKFNFLKRECYSMQLRGSRLKGGSPPRNEREPFLKRWQVANYTSVKSFTFWKGSAKLCNFRVPV